MAKRWVSATPTVLLFDIDGTLLNAFGASKRAFARTFEHVHGRRDAFRTEILGGMTDRAIARLGLENVTSHVDEVAIDNLMGTYLAFLEEEILTSSLFCVMPGVPQLLETLASYQNIALGVGTGNIRAGAAFKLRRGGLEHAFSFGGFGCDHEERSRLLLIGAERGAVKLGVTIQCCRLIVVGDTPRDVAAAQAIGAECLGVGTGDFGCEALRQCGAVRTVVDLTAPEVLPFLCGDLGHR